MPRKEQACVGYLALLLLLFLGSLMRAPAQFFWFLRVGIPELGAYLFLTAIPPALWLARKSPKVASVLLVAIGLLALYPWVQAVLVARQLPAGIGRAFGERTVIDRFPLTLGKRLTKVTVRTEPYQDKLLWDRYTPEGEIKARVLFVHGGSWRNGTRQDYSQLMTYLASRGYEVISPTYSLAPERPYPAALDDLDAAIAKLSDGKTPLFMAGRSSGGHLALLAAYRHPDKISGVIDFYAPVDMVWSWENPSNPAVLNSQEALAQFLGGTPAQRPEVYRDASPIHQVTEKGPPTLMIHGQRDCLVYLRQSQMLSQQLINKGVDHYLLELPWAEHGGDVTLYGPTGRLSAWAIESFLQGQLK